MYSMQAVNAFRAAFDDGEEQRELKQAFRVVLRSAYTYAQFDNPIDATTIAEKEIAAYQWEPVTGGKDLSPLHEVLAEFGCEVNLLGSLLMQLELEGVTTTLATETSLRRIGGSIAALATINTEPVQLSCYPEVVRKVLAFASANPAKLYRASESPCVWFRSHTDYLLDMCEQAGAPAMLIKSAVADEDALLFADDSTIEQRTLYSHLVQTRAHLICSAGRACVAREPGASVRAVDLYKTLSLYSTRGTNLQTLDGRLFLTLAGLCTSEITAALYKAIVAAGAYTVVVRGNTILPVLYMRRM
jgi:hypothetical protein